MTPEELAGIKVRAETATPGPWKLEFDSDVTDLDFGTIVNWPWQILAPNIINPIVDFTGGSEICDEDAKFIAHARTDIPILIAEIERLQILFAYTEGNLPGKLAAKALGTDGFEMTLLIEAAVKAGKELARNGYNASQSPVGV